MRFLVSIQYLLLHVPRVHSHGASASLPLLQQETMGQPPDPPAMSGLTSALWPCPPLVSAPKGEQGCVPKCLIKKSPLPGGASPSFPQCWWAAAGCSVRQAGRSREKHIWGKYLQSPALSWVAFSSLWCGKSEKRLWQVSLLVPAVIFTPCFTASTQKQLRIVQAWLIPTTHPSSSGWSPSLCDVCEPTTHEPRRVSPWSTDPAGPGLVLCHVLPLGTWNPWNPWNAFLTAPALQLCLEAPILTCSWDCKTHFSSRPNPTQDPEFLVGKGSHHTKSAFSHKPDYFWQYHHYHPETSLDS